MEETLKSSGGPQLPPELVPRYCIGTPGQPHARMLKSVMAMRKPPGTLFLDGQMNKPVRDKLDIASARNGLIEDFLTAHEKFNLPEPLQWLLQMDGDCIAHPLTLHRLSSWNKAAVGALCFTRYVPYQPVVYRGVCKQVSEDMRSYYVQWKEVVKWIREHPGLMKLEGFAVLDPAPADALRSVDWTGSHCFLIHRSVYEKLGPPWFENASNMKYGSGSDRLFFEKVKAAGFDPCVDFSVVAGHLAERVLGSMDFMAWQSITMRETPESVAHYVGDDTVYAANEQGPEWYDQEFLDHSHFHKHYRESPWFPLWQRALLLLKEERVKKVLDIGCGPGQVAQAVYDLVPSVVQYNGIDFSGERIAQAVKVRGKYATHPGRTWLFARRDIFEDGSLAFGDYDAVLMTEFLEHVTRDLEILEAVRPGAFIVATVPDFLYEGHVRAFSSMDDVFDRYRHLIQDMSVETVDRGNGGVWFVLAGRRRE